MIVLTRARSSRMSDHYTGAASGTVTLDIYCEAETFSPHVRGVHPSTPVSIGTPNNTRTNADSAVITTKDTVKIHPVYLMNACSAPKPAITDPQTRQIDLGCESASRCATVHIHHRYLLLLLRVKACTHFIVLRREER